jgi:hypothetical protein
MKSKLLFAVVLIVCLPLLAFGGDTDIMATLSGGTAEGNIAVGSNFSIIIKMYNDWGNHVGLSMPLYYYSPDQSIHVVTHRNSGGMPTYDWHAGDILVWDSSITYLNGWQTYWDQLREFYSFSWDGNLPDTVNHTVIGSDGWYPDVDTTAYLAFAFRINEEGTFCIDSCSIPDPYDILDWLFDDPGANFNGPYCWQVVAYQTCGDLNDDGEINILDITSLIDHIYFGEAVAYPQAGDVNADDNLNILDVVIMIDHVFGEGSVLNCI